MDFGTIAMIFVGTFLGRLIYDVFIKERWVSFLRNRTGKNKK